MLGKEYRLKKTSDFQEILRQKKSFGYKGLLVKTKFGETSRSRVAIVVGRKVAAKATKRNRIRRLLREALRKKIAAFPRCIDAVIIVLPTFKAESLEAADSALYGLFRKVFPNLSQ